VFAHQLLVEIELAPTALAALENYSWPGKRARTTQRDRTCRRLVPVRSARARAPAAQSRARRLIKVLEESGGNQATTAQRLGVSRRTLVYRLSALGLTRPRK